MRSSIDDILQSVLPGHAEAVAAFARNPRTFIRFETLNDYGIPPVADLFRYLLTLDPAVQPSARINQVLGRLTAAVLAKHGLQPARTARIPPMPGTTAKTGALFTETHA